ncbi:hypothetical protein RGV33_14865 [Pseudomonas sp. Bout1]|uniref:hypothetical protein n=1 Tax=Pseudomonas sp. Bout1 TaxID=3048600 RepID=UPI002AB371F0|nr:hypothetical protein [Pseudomonas sp. Bout1]MDY7532948.1 hypothetical protein [Pseudomonas sp. Bout1]MEB0188968.1 hypothetical protein [Pseudomonas sp. Bout1]
MNISSRPRVQPLPVPPNYMRAAEQQQVREMHGPAGSPAGDHRSAERIIDQSPVLKHFLKGRDHYQVGDDLKRKLGDWSEANPDPASRANAAYNLDKVLRLIDNLDDRKLNASQSRNGIVDGFSDDGYKTRDHSEAWLLGEFSRRGYKVLRNA